MKKSWALLALLYLCACGGGGGGGTPPPPPPPPPPEPTAIEAFTASIQNLTLDAFYEVSYGGLLTRTPETIVSATLEGIFPLDQNDLNDLSEGYVSDTFEMFAIALAKLQTYDRATLSSSEQIDYDVYEWFLQDQVDEGNFRDYGFPATYGNFGTARNLERFFTDLHPLNTAADAQAYADRLSAVDNKLAALEAHLLRQQAAGVVEPALTMQVAINQISVIASTAAIDNPYYTNYRDKITNISELSTAQRANFRDIAFNTTNSSVIPAYQRLLSTLQSLLPSAPADIGVGQYPQGPAYYDYVLRHYTTTNLTPAEIHQLGLDELVRIQAEMRTIFDQLGYPQNETLQELFARVEADGGIILAADSLTTFENLVAFAEANLSQAFDIFPNAPVVVLPDPFGGFYIGPSFDGTRPGAFYAGTDFDQPYYQMPSLTYHESVPGHHMQIAIAGEQNVPTFRKIVRTGAFVEGWALYAERLAFELGWYNNDVYGDLGRLQYEALRAARLVMDTGIHDLGWSFDQATQFNEDNVGWSTQASQGAAGRYSVIPGQATGYMIGFLQIMAERERAQTTLGADYDLIEFHRAVLTNGGVPLSVLSTVVDQYIADVQAGN